MKGHRTVDRPIRDLATHDAAACTVSVVAEYLECDERTVRRMIRGGHLFAFRVGPEWRVPTSELRRMFPVERHSTAS
jgi:excisionase family DNA binding protein